MRISHAIQKKGAHRMSKHIKHFVNAHNGIPIFNRKKVIWGTNGIPKEVLKDALSSLSPEGNYFVAEIPVKETLFSSCVETKQGDKIVFARRKKREGFSRMVKNRVSRESNVLTVILKKMMEEGEEGYLLITAFAGENIPKEPWDPNMDATESEISKDFWSSHALVYDEATVAEVAAQTPSYYL